VVITVFSAARVIESAIPRRDTILLSEFVSRMTALLAVTLLAVFGRAIRADADRDLLVLTLLERRNDPAARRMLGPFLYLTPVRLQIAPDEPWEATVQRVGNGDLQFRRDEWRGRLSWRRSRRRARLALRLSASSASEGALLAEVEYDANDVRRHATCCMTA